MAARRDHEHDEPSWSFWFDDAGSGASQKLQVAKFHVMLGGMRPCMYATRITENTAPSWATEVLRS